MLTESLSALEQEGGRVNCPVASWIEDHPEEGPILDRLLKGSVSTRRIYDTLKKEGVTIGRESLALHRKGRCACPGPEDTP